MIEFVRVISSKFDQHFAKPTAPEAFNQQKSEVSKIYSEVGYWHGTGRYQIVETKIIDVLAGICRSGLTPNLDFWDTVDRASISLTTMRLYASLYADMHSSPEEQGFFDDPRKENWGKIIQFLTLQKLPSLLLHLPKIYRLRNETSQWLSRRLSEQKSGTAHEVWNKALNLKEQRSSIPGNYSMLIGVKKNSFLPDKIAAYLTATETRTSQSIDILNITHIEVPPAHLEETKAVIERHGLQIPVIGRDTGGYASIQIPAFRQIKGDYSLENK